MRIVGGRPVLEDAVGRADRRGMRYTTLSRSWLNTAWESLGSDGQRDDDATDRIKVC